MDCKYMHTTIQKSQKILRCIALPNDEYQHDFCHILLIYRNYAQVLNVDISNQDVQVTTVATYPLYVPIVWCCIVGEHIAAVTEDAHLIMLKKKPPFERVSKHLMSEKLSPSTIPIAHCATSPSGEFFVACGFTENLVVAQFDSQDNPSLQSIKLPDFFVIEVVPTQNPSVFAFLVSVPSGVKYLIHFDMQDFVETSRAEVPSTSITITSVFNSDGYSKLVLFTSDKIFIKGDEETGDIECDVDARVHSWFVTPSGEIIVQLLNQEFFGIKTSQELESDRIELLKKGKLPLISTFCCLSNNLLLCVSEESDSFFLPISFSAVSIMSEHSVDFELLPRTSIPLTPRITSAFFHEKHLILSSGGLGRFGESGRYLLSSITNSISFSSNIEEMEATTNFTNAYFRGGPIRFFSVPDDCLIASSDKKSVVLKGNQKISAEPTIAIGKFGHHILQIHVNGLSLSNGKTYIAEYPVVAASIGEELCVVSFKDDHVRILDKDLHVDVEKVIYHAHAFAFCNNNIAIAANPPQGGNSTVTLYSFDLMPTDDVGQLTSSAHTMLFQQASNELFVSTQNGTVSRWTIGNDFSNSCAQIYEGTIPPLLLPYSDYLLIVSDNTFLFNGFQLLSIDLTKPIAICPANEENDTVSDKIYVMDESNVIRKIQFESCEKDLASKNTCPTEMPRKTAYLNKDSFVCITRHRESFEKFKSSLLVVKDDAEIPDQLNSNTVVFDTDSMGAISVETIAENIVACGFVKPERAKPENVKSYGRSDRNGYVNNGYIMILHLDTNVNLISCFDLYDQPYVIKKVGKIAFVGVGPNLLYLQKSNDEKVPYNILRTEVRVPSAVGFIEATENMVWIGDRIESVFVFRYSMKDENTVGDNFTLIACDPEPRQLTSMCLLNDECLAVGEKNGTISILRLPNDDIGDSDLKWRFSPIPERGISLNQSVGHLVKIATFSVSEAVTSLLIGSKGALFYTTLLGQIGAFVPLEKDVDYLMLLNTELITERLSAEEFGLTMFRRFPTEKTCVVSADILNLIEHLAPDSQTKIETACNTHWQSLFGLICRISQKAKF